MSVGGWTRGWGSSATRGHLQDAVLGAAAGQVRGRGGHHKVLKTWRTRVTKMATVSQAYVVFGYMQLHFVILYVCSFHVHIIYEMLNTPMLHVLDARCMYLCNKDA